MARDWKAVETAWKATGCVNDKVAKQMASIKEDLAHYSRQNMEKTYTQSAAFAKQGDDAQIKRFDASVKALVQLLSGDKVLVSHAKAKAFVQGVINDLTEEYKYWSGRPLEKIVAASKARA